MEARIIGKGEREYSRIESFVEVYSNRVVSPEKGQFRFMLSKIEAHGKVPPHNHDEMQAEIDGDQVSYIEVKWLEG